MRPKSDQDKLIDWLNTLIMMAQWDKTLPLYFARLFEKPDKYQAALGMIRQAAYDGNPPSLGDALDDEEWRRVYRTTTRAESLRKLFAGDGDPFYGANADEISVLAEVSDLTTDPQTLFYSQNGTFQLVLEAVRQRPQLDTVELITDGLNKFYTLLDTNESIAEDLYELAGSYDWYLVLASLYDVRDYTTDETYKAKQRLDQWNRKLTTELRSIIFKPAKLYRVPKRLIRVAWEKRHLFQAARDRLIFGTPPPTEFEIRQQVANIAYTHFVEDAKSELGEIESDLQLLATVARHFISVRKFAKLDGLVYAWPRIASLAMANYANLEYVEDFFVARKPKPTPEELDSRDARELYELCENNGGLIRFLRLRPHFKEINEDELRRYQPLAPVTISDPSQPAPPPAVPLQTPSVDLPPVVQSVTAPTRICRLLIKPTSKIPATEVERAEIDYEVSMFVGDMITGKGNVKFSIRKILDQILHGFGVTSEESLQVALKAYFTGTNAEQVIARAGLQIFSVVITQTGLTQNFAKAFAGEDPVRFVIESELEELHYLPWEWFPRTDSGTLQLLAHPRVSLVRSRIDVSAAPQPLLPPPVRIMGLFPNSPLGAREISESSIKALEALSNTGARYQQVVRDQATLEGAGLEMERFSPHIIHYEGYVAFDPSLNPSLRLLFSSPTTTTEPVALARLESLLVVHKPQMLVIGRNESGRIYENASVPLAHRLNRIAVPAVLAPIRAIDDVTATSFTTEFYRAFIAGNTLEHALYTARRKVASRGGDWTPFALFANPSVLDFFQPLPPTA